MHRISFYILVALLAFAVGSFADFKFYFKDSEPSVTTQKTEKYKSESIEQKSISIPESSQKEETSYEEWATFEVLKPTIGKWLRGEKIESERQEYLMSLSGKRRERMK